jgi:hypothetical protein
MVKIKHKNCMGETLKDLQPSLDIMNHPMVSKWIGGLDPEPKHLLLKDNRKVMRVAKGEEPDFVEQFEYKTEVYEWYSYSRTYLIFTAEGKGTSFEIVTDLSLNDFVASESEGKKCVRTLKRLLKRFQWISSGTPVKRIRDCGLCGNDGYVVIHKNKKKLICMGCLKESSEIKYYTEK